LLSMTGFGRAEAEMDGRKITIEIKTVNHRFLDINVRIPRTLLFAEELIRKTIKDRLERGRVDVFVNYASLEDDSKKATADLGLIRSYLAAARQAAVNFRLEDDLKLSDIISIPDAIVIEEAPEDEEKQKALVTGALNSALDVLTGMRQREGEQLKANIIECLNALEAIKAAIDSKKDAVPREYAEKLRSRIAELTSAAELDEARFNAEVAYMADRADITEEIVRLETHISQFRAALSERAAVGRKLDFMVQEMNRELNTIGSKSQDMDITNAVIEGKSVVEKIREQVQNIE
jgi:uncharacterized protein (TIGR00255 family)